MARTAMAPAKGAAPPREPALPKQLGHPAQGKDAKPRKSVVPYLLIVPAVAILLLALAYPVGWQFITSFKEYGLAQQFSAEAPWVGLKNYQEIVTNPQTWAVVVRSVVFCLVNAIATVGIGTALALLMRAVTKPARLILQIAMLLAWATPVVAAMTIWNWLFDWKNGAINWILVRMGFESFEGHQWLSKPLSFYFVATVIIVWMSVPFVAFSVYAGLTQISPEVLEASSIDGARPWQRFAYIIVPMVRPVLTIVLLLQIIWDLRVFAQIKMLQDRGSNVAETDLLGTFIYREGVGSSSFGMASAMSIFVLLLTIALSAFYVRILLKDEEDR
jgi:N,N'-diacetylchitobiose transport system permease protein